MSDDFGNELAEIREIYFKATPATIGRDFARAIELLKAMASEADREKASVYMEGLAELRREFRKGRRPKRNPRKRQGA